MASWVNGMDESLQRSIRERAFALWEADGRPEGREVEYWLRAERELASPSAGDEEQAPTAADTNEQLRRSVRESVPAAEQLPTAADENPLSQRVQEAATEPSLRRSTLKGGDKVEQ
jgi:hypothetical protein